MFCSVRWRFAANLERDSFSIARSIDGRWEYFMNGFFWLMMYFPKKKSYWNEKQYRFFLSFFLSPLSIQSSTSSKGMPMNALPCLSVDGKRVNQSLACCRYLSRELGLSGANDWENLQIDTVADTVNDFRLSKGSLKVFFWRCSRDSLFRNCGRFLRGWRWCQTEEARDTEQRSHPVLSWEVGRHC